MKKRRELDALVGAVKSRRKSSKSGHELLRYNGSESSDCEDYSVVTKKTRGSGICTTCTSILTFLLLVACMLVCAGLTWMHVEMKKDLETLRLGLQAVEGKSVVNIDDIQKLLSQMSALNKSQTLESKRLTQFQANISSFNVTISKLSEDVAKLGQGLKTAPELKQLPEKLQTVSKSLATLGSDVAGMKDTVSSIQTSMKDTGTKLHDINTKIETLKQDTDSGDTTTNEVPPEIANTIQTFSKKLESMNTTTSAQLSVMMKSLSQHEERFVSLENVTDMLRKNLSTMSSDHSSISNEHAAMTEVLSSDQFKTSVTDIVHSMLDQMNHTLSGTESHSTEPDTPLGLLASVKDNLDRIKMKYDSLNTTVHKNADDIQNIRQSFVPIAMFNEFGDEFQAYVEYQNASIAQLTAKVEGKTVPPEPVTKAPGTESSKGNSSTTNGTAANPNSVTAKPVSSTAKPNTSVTESATTKAPAILMPSVIIPGIQTAEELSKAFRQWDRFSTGSVSYSILEDHLGPHKPAESDLKPFDKDHNDLYTIQEFAKALGITLNEEPHTTEPSGGIEH